MNSTSRPATSDPSKKQAIQVAIVDDHPLFRQGLRQMVEGDPRFQCIGEAGQGEAALALVERLKPDVLVLDLNLPDMSGLEVARQLQLRRSPTRVIILTMYKDEETFNRALDLGVKGFVLKENAVHDILSCLVAASQDEHYLSPSISGYLVQRRQNAELLSARKPGLSNLTKAERRVLKLIAEKKTSREIAAELFISPRTVEAHRSNICSKLELKGAHSLLHFALEHRAAL